MIHGERMDADCCSYGMMEATIRRGDLPIVEEVDTKVAAETALVVEDIITRIHHLVTREIKHQSGAWVA